MKFSRPSGMKAFTIVWFGQLISLTGSSMTFFALTIWAWEKTGQATALGLVGFFGLAPQVIFSPIAGALVDRWNRKTSMILSDLGTAFGMLVVLLLFMSDSLEIWHLYILAMISGTFQTFQWPAYSSAISVMIPKDQFTRSSAMISLAEWGSGIWAPVLAAALLGRLKLSGIITIDLITMSLAVITLLIVTIPNPSKSVEGESSKGSIWKESLFGFKYILAKPSLLRLQMIFFFGNFFAAFLGILNSPMILARTGNDATTLGSVQSIAAIGGVIGSLIITAWGGFKTRKVRGVLLGWIFSGFFFFFVGIGQGILWWGTFLFLSSLVIPLVNSSNQAIWQSKVPPDLQGRVFSVRRLIAQIVNPLGLLIAGPLADKIFEPAFSFPNNEITLLLSNWYEPGPGAGMGVLISIASMMIVFVGVYGFFSKTVREVETIIPDFDAEKKQAHI
ncbi:MAG TPA: MFS transporter [Anaerolineaceae bacterium]|nr:MFS transporter [Anaerolineaceae bacterium]